MKSIFFKSLAGLTAGMLAWVILEPSAPKTIDSRSFSTWEQTFLIVLSGLIAVAICAVSGMQQGSWKHVARQTGLGLIFGVIGGMVGASFGGELAQLLMPSVHPELGTTLLPVAMAWRTLALAPIGCCIGLGIGAAGLSLNRTIQGGIGGLLAGAAAGLAFDPLSATIGKLILVSEGRTSGEVGGPARALYAALLGFGIGLFIGIAERVMRSAWVRLHVGRNEGREWAIDRPQMSIGRSELADIPLHGDPGIAPIHAYIAKQGDGYILADAGTPTGTYLNGQRIMQAPLAHGNWIQVGGLSLEFLMRAGAAPVRAPEMRPFAYPIGYSNSVAPVGPVPTPQQPSVASFGNSIGMGLPPSQAGGQVNQSGNFAAQMGSNQPTIMDGNQNAFTQAGGKWVLVTLDGPSTGSRVLVNQEIEAGREVANGVNLAYDAKASRRHARISPAGLTLKIADLGSTNGTFVNGQRISTQDAKSGDIIRIGGTSFRVENN